MDPMTTEEQVPLETSDPVSADPLPAQDYTTVTPPTPVTTAEEAEYLRNQEQPTLWEGTKAAFQSEWSLYWGLGFKDDMMPDPDYVQTQDEQKRLTDGIPEEYWGYFDQAHSAEHGTLLREKMLKDLEIENKLGQMGWAGTGLRMAAALADPVAVGATLVSEGTLGPLMYGAKLTRLQRAMRIGAGASVTDMGVEAALVNQKPTGDAMDILYAAAGSFTLGSAFGAVTKGIDPDVNETIANTLADTQRKLNDGSIELLDSAGAMRAYTTFEPLSEEADDMLRKSWDEPVTAFGWARADSAGQVRSSPHPLARKGNLAEDTVGNADNSVNIHTASERQQLIFDQADTIFHREVGSAYRRWADEQKLGWLQRQRARKSFMEEVTLAIRDETATVSKQAEEAAASLRKQYEKLLMDAKASGVKGFENVAPNPNYINRMYDQVKMARLREKFGDGQMVSLIKHAIISANADIAEDVAEKFAKWHWKSIRSHAAGHDMRAMRALAGEDMDALRDIMIDEGIMDAADVDSLLNLFKNQQAGAHSRSKHRLMFDENESMGLRNRAGEVENVRIADLLDNDAERLFSIYNRQLSGAIALARSGFKSTKEFENYLKRIRQTADQVPGYTERQLQKDIENLQFQFSAVSGKPYNVTAGGIDHRLTKWGQIARMVRDYNFLRVMNQVGWAQLAELGTSIGEVGIRTYLKAMPGFRAMVRDARTGKLSDQFSDELEAIFGIGAERMRGVVSNRWDDFGNYINTNEGGILGKADKVMAHGKRFTADISGMAGINTVLHRWVVRGFAQQFADQAFKLTKVNMNRMKAAGLSEDMIQRVHEQMRKHGKLVDGAFSKKKLRGLNLEKWDVEVAEEFKLAVNRLARKAVQQNDVGNMHRWMASPMMQIIMQFRTFMMVSWAKQTLRGLHHRDWETFASWSLAMFSAGLAYTGQTYLKSIGRDDQDKYLRENLSTKAIGTASFMRAGWSSFLPPGIMYAADMFSDDPLLESAALRTTGLNPTGFVSNPTLDLADKTVKAVSDTGKLAFKDGYRLSKDNTRNYFGLLPFQNAMVIQNLQNVISADLPKRSE